MWLQPYFQSTGRLRFDRFMELALYDPDNGYYSRHLPTIGTRGDFSTSATLSPALARRLAGWIKRSRPRHVVEVGAGTGELSHEVLQNLGLFTLRRWGLPVMGRRTVRHHIVERSPGLRRAQRKLLGRAALWHADLPAALRSAPGNTFVFSNELVDAFPPRVFRRTGHWDELFLIVKNGALTEWWAPAASLPDSTVFSHDWPSGQRVEVHESYRQWLASWAPHWSSGQILTIDYGGSVDEIYHRRPAGTLRAYYRHQRASGEDLYRLPGRQDLTADVNFDDLMRWGEQLGLKTISLTNQAGFLNLDPADLPPQDRFLADPSGAGGAFKVLLQSKELDSGFSFP